MIKLLIVDDEGFVRTGLIRNIKWGELGIGLVEQADDGINAYEKAQIIKPDIILTDVRMPRGDGIELAFKIKEILPECKIIFMSAYSDKEYLKSAIKLKAINYIEKPINLGEVISTLTSTVSLVVSDREKLKAEIKNRSRLKEGMQLLQSTIVTELIKGNFQSDNVIAWLEDHSLELSSDGQYCVVELKLKPLVNEEAIDKNNALLTVETIISDYKIKSIGSFKDNDSIILILYSNSKDRSIFIEATLLENISRSILAACKNKYNIFINIGKIVGRISNIKASYDSIVASEYLLFFKGYGCLVYSEASIGSAFAVDESLFGSFGAYVEAGERDSAARLLNTLTKDIKNYRNTPVNFVKNIYFRLMQQLIHSAQKHGVNLYPDETEKFYWEIIFKQDTLDGINEYLLNMLDLFLEELDVKKDKSKTVTEIMKLISKSYSDPNLSIITIAEKLFLSHTYLCVLFKKDTGKTINQYITEYRVEKAKELLNNRKIKLSDIALQTGYMDHNYFTKIFKKTTGITPSEYRETHI